ncbi:unnamed protein product [Penicillium salamii]|nr:unnamed protein product [Penicillium salamii]
MIKVKGVQVWPAEIESLLLDHPAVNEAAVIGVRKGDEEYPRAHVVAAPGASVSVDEIVQFVNSKVSTIKRLTGGVFFTDAIPKSPVCAAHLLASPSWHMITHGLSSLGRSCDELSERRWSRI